MRRAPKGAGRRAPAGGLTTDPPQPPHHPTAVADARAPQEPLMEPTGGIDLDNFREIMEIILGAGVQKVIPHVYSSIIDKESGDTRTGDVKRLLGIVKELV